VIPLLLLLTLSASAFDHPGGITSSPCIQTVKQNLTLEPWKTAFTQLHAEATAALQFKTDVPETLSIPG
jgi:hypothetical protein